MYPTTHEFSIEPQSLNRSLFPHFSSRGFNRGIQNPHDVYKYWNSITPTDMSSTEVADIIQDKHWVKTSIDSPSLLLCTIIIGI